MQLRYTFADIIAAAKAMEAIEAMKADLAEFAAKHLAGDDGVVDYLEITSGDAFAVTPREAMAYFQAKGLDITFSYADLMGNAHDLAFTIAKMMDIDLLSQVRDSLDSALANGTPYAEWRTEIEPILKSAGWWGEAPMQDPLTGDTVTAQLGSAWRLETIFRTNLQTAYAAGQWREIESQKELAPFLMYDAIDDFRTREMHRSWDNKVLPVNSDWWQTHYPPNGYNCRCSVIQLDAEQLAALGVTPMAEPPSDGTYQWTNPRTGEKVDVPKGIDPGFDRNSGKTGGADLDKLMREKMGTLPDDMRKAMEGFLRKKD